MDEVLVLSLKQIPKADQYKSWCKPYDYTIHHPSGCHHDDLFSFTCQDVPSEEGPGYGPVLTHPLRKLTTYEVMKTDHFFSKKGLNLLIYKIC